MHGRHEGRQRDRHRLRRAGLRSCNLDKSCEAHTDCTSGLCAMFVCAPTVPISLRSFGYRARSLFGVTMDLSGNMYATGVAAPGTDVATDFATVVVKLKPTGALDPTFGNGGVATHNVIVGTNGEVTRGIGRQSRGKIVVSATVEHLGAADPRAGTSSSCDSIRTGAWTRPSGPMGSRNPQSQRWRAGRLNYVADSQWRLAVLPDDRLVIFGSQKRPGRHRHGLCCRAPRPRRTARQHFRDERRRIARHQSAVCRQPRRGCLSGRQHLGGRKHGTR